MHPLHPELLQSLRREFDRENYLSETRLHARSPNPSWRARDQRLGIFEYAFPAVAVSLFWSVAQEQVRAIGYKGMRKSRLFVW